MLKVMFGMVLLLSIFSFNVNAKAATCKGKRSKLISCEEVEGHQRTHFCVRPSKKLSQEKIEKVCKRKPKVAKAKKKAAKKKS